MESLVRHENRQEAGGGLQPSVDPPPEGARRYPEWDPHGRRGFPCADVRREGTPERGRVWQGHTVRVDWSLLGWPRAQGLVSEVCIRRLVAVTLDYG